MEKNDVKTKIGQLLNTNRTVKIAEILLLFIGAVAIIKILMPYAGDNTLKLMGVVWCVNIYMLAFIWLGIKLRGQRWSDFGLTTGQLRFKESLRTFLLSLLVCIAGLAGYVLGTVIMAGISGMPESADMSNYEYLQNNILFLVLTLAGVYFVSSFGEEVIYRAFLINRITELGPDSRYIKTAAVIISAVIFGLVHYEWGPTGMVSTGFTGLVLGIFYLKLKKRLWILVLAHAYMDTVLFVQLFLSSR